MKVAYILNTFPCRSEQFVLREIITLGRHGMEISVLAANSDTRVSQKEAIDMTYRPAIFSRAFVLSIAYVLVKYPFGLAKLLLLMFRVFRSSPREATSLFRNIHTVSYFVKYLDRIGTGHVHAGFLSWPACIGLAISVVSDRSFSIAAHARDVFVEYGALELKVSKAIFLTVCTEQGLNSLKKRLHTKHHRKLHLVYHGVEPLQIQTDLNTRTQRSFKPVGKVIAIGRLVPKKGIANLIRALALVLSDNCDCRLVIVGEGPERKVLRGLVEQLNLKDYVHFLGWQDPEKMREILLTADALIVPSIITKDGDRDGIPNVILEAFSEGVPVVASSLEGIREAVKHNETGLLVEPGDIRELAHAIEQILGMDGLRTRLTRRAYELLKVRFDLSRNATRLVKLFEGINGCPSML